MNYARVLLLAIFPEAPASTMGFPAKLLIYALRRPLGFFQ